MDQHISLHKSLDESNKICDLSSWTKHVNRRGIVYTVRYEHKAAILDPTPRDQNYTTYKPKSRYHAQRDYMRIKEFNNSHKKPLLDKNICTEVANNDIMQHSDTEPINQNTSQVTTHATVILDQASCLSDYSLPMSDSQSHFPSIEKHHAQDLQNLPPVEQESVDYILPPVQLQSEVSFISPVHLAYAESISPIWPPKVHRPEDVTTVSITQSASVNISPVLESLSTDDIYPASYEVDSSPDFSSAPTTYQSYQSNKSLICDECTGNVPSVNNMLYCEYCAIRVCGNCVSSDSTFHSNTCYGTFRFIRDSTMYQTVPDNAMISEITQPPGSGQDSDNQRVPTNSLDFYNPLNFGHL